MKVLFICYANVCRSFMAEELFRYFFPQAEVFSRGLYADPSFEIPHKVLDFLQTYPIHPTKHTPTPLTKQDLEKADFIFCMENKHVEQLADRYAQYTDKLWLLAQAASGQEVDVPDPIALEGNDFNKAAMRLAHWVQICAKRLAQQPTGETLGEPIK